MKKHFRVTLLERKSYGDGPSAKSKIKVQNAENFYNLYNEGIELGSDLKNLEPWWRLPKLCLICRKYNHNTEKCQSDFVYCVKCGGNHLYTECNTNKPYCKYCYSEHEYSLNFDHSCFDENCKT